MAIKTFLVCGLILAWSSQASANIVINGGFEIGDFSGWNVAGNTEFTGVDAITPHLGNFSAFSGAIDDPAIISQTLNTIAASTYHVSFWLQVEADDFGASVPNSFSVAFGGTSLLSVADLPASSYRLYEFDVMAPSISTTLTFTLSNNPAYFDLDDVSVTAVPEPSTWAMLILGLVGLSFMANRKARASAAKAAALCR